MKVLVLGGTVFGRHLVAALLARGHRVTTFNRGNHVVDEELPLTRIVGERTLPADLARIRSLHVLADSYRARRDVLVPGAPQRGIQFIDVRDLAAFVVDAVEAGRNGVYNVTSPRGAWSMRDLIDACRDVPGLPAVHWVDGAFLAEQGCAGWGDLPLWIRPDSPYSGILDVDVSRASAAGLRIRTPAHTVRATREWFARSGRAGLTAGLDSHRETELLERWNAAISS